jgi:hypothetical protein
MHRWENEDSMTSHSQIEELGSRSSVHWGGGGGGGG